MISLVRVITLTPMTAVAAAIALVKSLLKMVTPAMPVYFMVWSILIKGTASRTLSFFLDTKSASMAMFRQVMLQAQIFLTICSVVFKGGFTEANLPTCNWYLH
jgi:hypothetical protein